MQWKGKLIGLLLGLLTRRPQLVVIGLVLGHLYDIGLFNRVAAATPPTATPATSDVDPYTTLGVSASSSDADVEQAWRRKMSEYHPDRVANAAEEIRNLAEQRAREINVAYETIQQQRRKG